MSFKEIELNMGPQHPSTHGVLRLKVTVDNEVVLRIEPVVGYLHRGMEKLWESLTYHQIVPLTDRLDYIAAVSNNLAYVLTVEKLAGIEVPKRAQYIRVILAELMRISSHLAWIGFQANDIGAMSVLLYGFEYREDFLDIFETYAGGRLTIHAMRIGGVPFDLDAELIGRIRKTLDRLPKQLHDIEMLLNENRIWKHRTEGVGGISAEEAIDHGLTGPCLRASGVPWDIRKDIPYSSYEDFDFDVPLSDRGDVYDRYLVRMEEMRQSVRIIGQALDRLPAGEHLAKVPRVLKIPAGEVFHTIEAPKGELGFYHPVQRDRQARADEDEIPVVHQPPVAARSCAGGRSSRTSSASWARSTSSSGRSTSDAGLALRLRVPDPHRQDRRRHPLSDDHGHRHDLARAPGRGPDPGPARPQPGRLPGHPPADRRRVQALLQGGHRPAERRQVPVQRRAGPGHVLLAPGVLLRPPRRAHPDRHRTSSRSGSPRARSACSSSWGCRPSRSSG